MWTEELQHSDLQAHSPSGDWEQERRQRAPSPGMGHTVLYPSTSPRARSWALHLRQDSRDKEQNRATWEWGQTLPALPQPLPAAEFGCGSPCTGWLSELAAQCPAGLPRSHHTYIGENQPLAAEKPGSPPVSQISLPNSADTCWNIPSAGAPAPSLLPKDRLLLNM